MDLPSDTISFESKSEYKEPATTKPTLLKSFEGKSEEEQHKNDLRSEIINIFKTEPKITESKKESNDKIKFKPIELTKLSETVAKQPKPLKKYEAPKPVSTEKAKPIKIKISEVDAVTSKMDTKVIETCSKSKPEVKKPPKSMVKLIKENLIYE